MSDLLSGKLGEQKGLKERSKRLSDTTLIFLFPIFGYIIDYAYEYGFAIRFQIPLPLIKISLSDLLSFTVSIPAAFIYGFGLMSMAYNFKLHTTLMGRMLLRCIFMVGMVILIGYAYDFPTRTTVTYILIGPGLFLLSTFVFSLFSYKKIKGLRARIEVGIRTLYGGRERDLGDEAVDKLGLVTWHALYVLILVIVIVLFLGAIDAKTRKSFMVINSSPELVILRKYSGTLICSEFNREKKQFGDKFLIKTIDQISQSGTPVTFERIGPLKRFNKKLESK